MSIFRIELSLAEIRQIRMASEAAYQAARWIRQFHRTLYSHVGFMDHLPDSSLPDVLEKHGFVRVPRFELNMLRLLLQTYGPLLITGTFLHLAQNEAVVPLAQMALTRVNRYENQDHALILNGYWDGFEPRLLFRDPAHPERQFVDELGPLLDRQEPGIGVFYQNCPAFPKPCPHLPKAPKPERQSLASQAANRDPAES